MPQPPMPNITVRDLEILMDAYAYLLQNDPRTSGITWILGDVGMGSPAVLPFGYISPQTESVSWYTASGGMGGLAAAGPKGLDDWAIPVLLTIAHEPHQYVPPVAASPGPEDPNNPFTLANLGQPVNYLEQPGWRSSLATVQNIKKVLRTNATIGGAASDTRIVESRFLIQDIANTLYRATRMTLLTQQRRLRGD